MTQETKIGRRPYRRRDLQALYLSAPSCLTTLVPTAHLRRAPKNVIEVSNPPIHEIKGQAFLGKQGLHRSLDFSISFTKPIAAKQKRILPCRVAGIKRSKRVIQLFETVEVGCREQGWARRGAQASRREGLRSCASTLVGTLAFRNGIMGMD